MKKTLLVIFLFIGFSASSQNEFITEWNITSNTIVFPGIGSGYTITWEQVGNPSNSGTITNAASGQTLYLAPLGTYVIKASPGSGTFNGFNTSTYNQNRSDLAFVRQWGTTTWQELTFALCVNMDVTATDVPLFNSTSEITYLFNGCENLVGNSSFNNWNTSAITSMLYLFAGAQKFNQPIDNWVTTNVTNMAGMFLDAWVFNQPIGNWDVSNVEYMDAMFSRAYVFNQPIGGWNTGNVIRMSFMFQNNAVFNQPLNNWNTSKVVEIGYIFSGATAFNQPLDKWDTRRVTDMSQLFDGATSFNQSLATWSLQSVTDFVEIGNSGIDCQNYSATLNAWAADPATPGNISFYVQGLEYSASAQNARNTLVGKGWDITGDTYNAACSAALPVKFGNIHAFLKNGSLQINWETLSENNNDHFIIEVSRDGSSFVKLATVDSKALNGNSDNLLKYEYSIMENEAAALLGGSALLAFLLIGVSGLKRRNKLVMLLAASVLISLLFNSCTKSEQVYDTANDKPLYIKITQVDKDGKAKSSGIIKALRD